MIFSRTVSRVSGAVVAFVVAIGYCGLLALLPRVICDGPASSPFLAANVFATVLAPLLALSLLADQWRGGLRWLSLPLLVLLPLAGLAVWPFLGADMLERMAACESPVGSVRGWHAWWARIHLVVLLALALVSLRFWRPSPGNS